MVMAKLKLKKTITHHSLKGAVRSLKGINKVALRMEIPATNQAGLTCVYLRDGLKDYSVSNL